MNEIYIIDGKKFRVGLINRDDFLAKNPTAQLFVEEEKTVGPQEEGKPEVAVEEVAPAVTKDTALQLENGSLESKKTPADPIEEEYRNGTRKTVTVQGNEYSYEEIQKEYVGEGKGKFKNVEDYVKAFPKSYKASIQTQNKDYQTEAELNKTIGIQYDPNDGSKVNDPMSKGFIDSIQEVTVDSTREIILKDYFNLDQIPVIKSKSTGILPGQVEYINKPIPIKEYLGEEKYKQYLDQENIDIKDLPQDFVKSTINREKQRAAQLFINDNELSEIEQNKMLGFLPGDDDFRSDIAKNEVAYTKDALDFEAKFGRDLVRTETIQDRTYKFRGDSQTKDALKAIESQEKRVFEEIKLVTKDSETFIEEKIPNFEKQVISLDSEITNLKEQIKIAKPTTQEELGIVNNQIVDLNSKVELRNNYVKNTIFDLELEKQELNKRNNSIVNSFEDFGVTKIGNEAIQKNYKLENRISLAIEQSFIGSGTMLGASALKGIANTVQFVDEAMFQREGASDFVGKETHNYLKNLKGGAINYNQALAKEKENQPDLLRYGDKGYWSRTLADQSGSILTTVSTMGAAKLGLIGTKTVAKAMFGAFFTMEAGGEMSNLEIQQRAAPKVLANLNLALESATNPYDIERIKKEISEQEDVLNLSQFQKSFNSVAYGAIAAGAETLGSLGFIGNFQKYAKAIGYNSFRKVFNAGLSRTISKSVGAVAVGMPLSISINTLEETLTTLGQNLSDEAVLQQDKNFFEGIDSDFFRSTAVTSLALGGPAIGSNIYNAVSQEFSDRTEARKESKLRGELLNIQTQLDKGGLTIKARNLLEKSKKKALEKLALDNTNKVLKISDLTADEFESITETNRELRNVRREAANIGASGDVSTWSENELDRLKTEYDNLLSNRQKVFDGKRQEVLDMFKGQTSDVVEAANSYGLYEFSKNVTRNQKGINQIVFNNRAEFEAYLKDNNYSDENQTKALEGYDNDNNAANPTGSNDILVFKENIVKNIATKGRIGARIAAMSPLHELGHIQTRKAGIIKDGKVSGNAVKMIEGIKTKVKNLLDQGSIKKEEYDAFENRIDDYKDTNGEIDADELIQAVADFTNMGVLPKSAFNSVFEIKTYVNSVMKYINGDASMYFQLDTADDVFNFVSSWTTKATQGIQLGTEEDEKKTGKLNLSRSEEASTKVQELYDAQGEAAAFDIIEQFKPITNKIVEKRSQAPGFDRQLLTDEVETGKRGILDLIKEYKPESGVPLAAYINKFLPARAIEASKRILGEEFTDDVTEAKGVAAEEIAVDVVSTDKQATSKLRRVLGIKQGDEIYDLAKEVSGEILSSDLPGKKVKTAVNKKARESKLRKAVSDLMGTEKAIDEQFLNKNILEVLKALPASDLVKLEREAKVKVLAEQGPRLNVKDAREAVNKGILPKDTNLQSGPKVSSKLPTTLEQAKEFFNQKRKAGLVNVVTEMLVKDAAPEVTEGKIEPAKRAKVLSEIDRAPTLKFSLSTKQDIAFEENENIDTGHVTFEGEFKVGDTQFGLKLIPLNDISDDFEAEFELKKQLEAKGISTKELLSVEFEDYEGGLDITGKSLEGKTSAIKTFSIVANSVLDFVKENNIKGVVFNSSESNRTRLYKAMVDRFSKELGWEYKQIKTTPVQGEVDTFIVTPKETTKEQPTLKFSKGALSSIESLFDGYIDNPNFDLDLAGQNKLNSLLKEKGVDIALNLKQDVRTVEGRKRIVDTYKWVMANLGPRDMWFGAQGKNKFTTSGSDYGVKGEDPQGRKDFQALRDEINALGKKDSGFKFGKPIDGVSSYSVSSYSTLLGDPKNAIIKNENGEIEKFNKNVKLIHAEMWKRIYKLIGDDKQNASKIGSYLKLVANHTGHWHKLGAQIAGWSTDPKGKTNSKGNITSYEYEHAMPATAAYLYLMDLALNQGNFQPAYDAVMDNYRLIALDKNENEKLAKAGLGRGMPKNWKLGENFWWQRYFNTKVAAINGGIPSSSLIFLNGKTFQEELNVNSAGDKTTPALETDKKKASKSNNSKLPNEFKLTGEFNNQQVLDEMAEIDNDSQESELKFSKALDLDKDFNDIIENKTGIASDKTYARVKAEVAGANKGRFNFFIPPSAEDFVGLLYSTLGKGDVGDAQMAWYKSHLLNPFARAMENLANDRVALMQDFKGLKKALKIVPKNLRKKIKDSDFTKEQAVRVAIWEKQGMTVPGLSQKDQQELVDYVNNDADLTIFADQLIAMGKGDAYAAPDGGWVAGTIDTDFIKALNTVKRDKYLEVWQQNADEIFSEANLNKLEAAYGKPYREAMENILKRMSTGKNTSSGSDRLAARFTDWLTNSVGAIMFFNTRSAVLQTISAVNFVNFSDNNVLKAGQAFANQPQYWSDFKKLFNSPFLLDRRSGLKLNVNEADIADMAKGPGNGARNVIAGILKAGFLPTQLADSFAIASGGASFYRNRIKALQKEGLTEAEAEEQAFRDFREIAEESQQSSRPDKISQQQAGPLGRVVLAFANTPAQYARLIKKAASDLKNGRGDAKTNISKIIYYGVAQNLLFSALQQALFAIAFDDDEEDEKKNEKYFNIVNGMSDSILRGVGVGGAIVSVVKNTAIRLAKEADKKSPKYQDAVVKGVLQISPPISSKVGKLQSAGRSFSWNQEEMRTRGWSIDNPAYLASANVISAATNIPLDRAVKKITNIVDAGNEDIEYYKRVALALGWSAWELGIDKKGGKVAPPKTDMDKLYDLNKKQQIDSLTSLGISKKQIKLLKLEEDRVNAILNPKSIKPIKVSKKDSLFGLNKKDQVKALEKLGLTKKEIRALRLESDRVEAIINQQKEKVE